jgi:O-methyltransferase involved in polyketide biosynthesis
MELRYLSSEKVIRASVERGEVNQIIELASGFTPHSVNLLTTEPNIKIYLENDFPVNSEVKQEALNEFVGGLPVKFVPGNVLEKETWEKFESQLGEGGVAIFCEGLIMYLSREQQVQLLANVKHLLEKTGGFFMHEDMLKYHPELKDDPKFSWIVPMLKSISSNSALSESYSQEDLTKFYQEQGFVIDRVPEDVPLSFDKYPDQEENARTLQQAFRMWKLSLPK